MTAREVAVALLIVAVVGLVWTLVRHAVDMVSLVGILAAVVVVLMVIAGLLDRDEVSR